MASGTYTVTAPAQTLSTIQTILQITAPATASLILYRAWIMQSSSTTSAMLRVRLLRKSGTVTGGTATPPTPIPTEVGMAAAGTAVIWLPSGEGTDGVVLTEEVFNILNGWLWLPVPEERIIVPPSGILGLKLPAAPTSGTFSFGLTFREVG